MPDLLLKGARVARGPNTTERIDISLSAGRISFSKPSGPASVIDLSGTLLLPGLINAHDRLDLNLPSCLPYPVRLLWGGIRNLLSGVTTVAHHGRWESAVFTGDYPVRVVRELGVAPAHTEPADLAQRFWKHPPRWPFVIPDAPGIAPLDKLGVLNSHTVLRNPPPISASDLQVLLGRHCSLILNALTCSSPASLSGVPASLATDSGSDTQGDLLDVIRAARLRPHLRLQQIFSMVTTQAAAILRLTRGQGAIVEGGVADLIAVHDAGQTPAEAIQRLHPELVMIGGRIKLVSPRFAAGPCAAFTSHFAPIHLAPRGAWFLDLPPLLKDAVPEPGFQLGGRTVSYSI